MLYSGIAYFTVLVLMQVLGGLMYLVAGGVGEFFNLFATVATAVAVGVPALVYQACFAKRRGLRLCAPGRSSLMIIPLAAVGMLAFNMLTALMAMLLDSLGDFNLAQNIPIPESPAALFVSFFVVALIPALFEEMMFRGCVEPALEHKGKVFAIVFSGLVFGMMHGQLVALPVHVLLGMVLAYLYVISKSLWVPILYHFTHNAVSMAVAAFAASMMGEQGAAHADTIVTGIAEMDALVNSAAFQAASVAVAFVALGALFAGLLVIYRMLRKKETACETPVSREFEDDAPSKARWYAWTPYALGLLVSAAIYVVMTMQSFGLLPTGV